jgi:hypothetical protein
VRLFAFPPPLVEVELQRKHGSCRIFASAFVKQLT